MATPAEQIAKRNFFQRRRVFRRVSKQLRIGLRWLRCGGRLFMRHLWVLGGMGFSAAVLINVLTLIPLLGNVMIALLAPILLGSTYLTIDRVARQKMALPASLRLAALKRSPQELVGVVRSQSHLMSILVFCVYSMAVALAIGVTAQLVGGSAWVSRWTSLDFLTLTGMLGTAGIVLVLYLLLAMSLIYALALSVLRNEALMPAVIQSLKLSARYPLAVLLLFGLFITPFLLGSLLSPVSMLAAYLVWIVGGGLVLPIVAASFYCSYRTLFAAEEAAATA